MSFSQPSRPFNLLSLLSLLLGIVTLPSIAHAEEPASSTQVVIAPSTSFPAPPSAERSGQSGGVMGEHLVLLGGVDSQGQIVKEALILPLLTGAHWKSLPLEEGRAWAASAISSHHDLILAGGLLSSGPTAKVTRVSLDGEKLAFSDLPPLPKPLAGAGAAIIGEKLYVVGGISSTNASEVLQGGSQQAQSGSQPALSDFLVLDLAHPEQGWSALAPLPGAGKLLPMVASQYDMIEVIGGREAHDGSHYPASKEVWTYRYKPAEGTTTTGWAKGADLPEPLAGGTAIPSGQAHILILGADSTPEAVTPFFLSESNLSPTLLFHVVTDAWNVAGPALSLHAPACGHDSSGKLFVFGGKGLHDLLQVTIPRTARNLNWVDYLMILFYFSFIAYIGYYFRKQKSTEEFALGNRETVWWAAGISMFATAASAISFMAVPALAFASNLVWLFPLIVLLPVYFFQSRITYPILRRLEITSTFEYLERRFNTELRLIASFLQIVFQVFGRASVVLVLPSIAIAATTGLDVRWSVIIMGVLTTIYTGMGGFEAVTWTLVFQGILKALAPIAIIWIAIASLPGGLGEFFHTNFVHHKFDFVISGFDLSFPIVWIMLINIFLQNTIYQAGDQTIIQRIFASKDSEIRKITAMNFSCGAFIGVLVTVMGLAIFAYFHAHPEKFDAGSTIDQIVPLFVIQGMPHGAVGIVIAAIFASAMATVASGMNSVATIFTVDFYERWKPASGDSNNLFVMRMSTFVAGGLATLIALWLTTLNLKSIMVTWNIVSSLLGGGVVGIFALGMFSTRANSGGAICGSILSILIGFYVKFCTTIHWSALLPIMIFSSMIIGYFSSFLFKSKVIDLTGLTIFHLKADPKKEG